MGLLDRTLGIRMIPDPTTPNDISSSIHPQTEPIEVLTFISDI